MVREQHFLSCFISHTHAQSLYLLILKVHYALVDYTAGNVPQWLANRGIPMERMYTACCPMCVPSRTSLALIDSDFANANVVRGFSCCGKGAALFFPGRNGLGQSESESCLAMTIAFENLLSQVDRDSEANNAKRGKPYSYRQSRYKAYLLWKQNMWPRFDKNELLPIPVCVLSRIRIRFTNPIDEWDFKGSDLEYTVYEGRPVQIEEHH